MELLLTGVYVLACLTLGFAVLAQPGEGGGPSVLGGAAVEKALGTRATAMWRRAAWIASAGFLLLAIALGHVP